MQAFMCPLPSPPLPLQAFMGPMHPDAVEFRTTKVRCLPQDLFMIMRVVTLLRGVLASMGVDVSRCAGGHA